MITPKDNINSLFAFCILILILGCKETVTAQERNGCLNQTQILRMQDTDLNDINSFLRMESWVFDGAISNHYYQYSGFNLTYDCVKWKSNSRTDSDQTWIFTKEGKPSIVVYHTSEICFNLLIQEIGEFETGKISIQEDYLQTSFTQGSLTIEFREYNYSKKNQVIVLNSLILNSIANNQTFDKDSSQTQINDFKSSNARNQGGLTYNLSGRRPQILPIPEYNIQAQGRVVVSITVDRQGRVTRAAAGARGTTTSNPQLWTLAEEAALKARFEPQSNAPEEQTGSITYNFLSYSN